MLILNFFFGRIYLNCLSYCQLKMREILRILEALLLDFVFLVMPFVLYNSIGEHSESFDLFHKHRK